MDDSLPSLRIDYGGAGFDAADAGDDPMALFVGWFGDARARGVSEPNAMSLATVGAGHAPSVRMVLLKGLDVEAASFTWYTNLDSRKAREARGRGRAALCWWWPGAPGRQVRAVGRVVEVPRPEADRYFRSRPAAARAGAAASRQSRALAHRAELEQRARIAATADEPLPERWGGLRLVAEELEFWQGRPGRLHDRIVFLRCDAGAPVSIAAVEAAGGEQAVRAAGTLVTDAAGTEWLRLRLEP